MLLYTLFAALIYVVVGLPLAPMTLLLGWLAPAIEITVGALLFLLALDGLALAALWPVEWVLSRGR